MPYYRPNGPTDLEYKIMRLLEDLDRAAFYKQLAHEHFRRDREEELDRQIILISLELKRLFRIYMAEVRI